MARNGKWSELRLTAGTVGSLMGCSVLTAKRNLYDLRDRLRLAPGEIPGDKLGEMIQVYRMSRELKSLDRWLKQQ